MAMSKERIRELAQLLAGHAKKPKLRVVGTDDYTERTKESWRWYEANLKALAPAPIDQSERARNIREINRISNRHNWGVVVEQAIDRAAASHLDGLDNAQICDLVEEMRLLVDRAETGCDMPDVLPAR